MLLENSFDVPSATDRVWAYLLDVERVVRCMPGAELTETIDDRNFKGKVKINVGPVSLSFAGKVTMQERDDAAHRVVLRANGMEQRGKGAASATITSTLEQTDSGTRVKVVQDLTIQGQAAQVARGMLPDIAAKLTQQFADCIKANLDAQEKAADREPVEVAPAGPVNALALAFGALLGAARRFFSRLLPRK